MTKTVSITSGKGGVGKTTFVVGIAQSLSQIGKRTLIVDGDLGMANCDIHLGVRCDRNLHDVVRGDCSLAEIITDVDDNLSVVSGGSGIYELGHLNAFERRTIVDELETVIKAYDLVLIDTSPGLHENVLYMNANAALNLVIITPDPSSFTDAYALIKVLHQRYSVKSFVVAVNMVKSDIEGVSLFEKFYDVARKFLNLRLNYIGCLHESSEIRKYQIEKMKRTDIGRELPQLAKYTDIGLALMPEIDRLNQRSDFAVWKEVSGMA